MKSSSALSLLASTGMYGPVWLIESHAYDALALVLNEIDMGAHMAEFAARQRENPEPPKTPPFRVESGVAVIPIDGVMTKKPHSMQAILGGTSTMQVRQQLRDGRRDKDVKCAVLDFHTPGGDILGLSDLGYDVRAFAAEKPIYAYIADFCASAGVWIASQCDGVFCGPGAFYGSIGTYRLLEDSSRMMENLGIKREVIANKESVAKGAGERGTKVTDAHRADFQRVADEVMGLFAGAVARGRGMDDSQVRALATGQMWGVNDALRFGLIDGIMSMDECISCCQSGEWPDGMMAGVSGREKIFMFETLKNLVGALTGSAKEDKEKATADAVNAEVAEAELAVKAAQAADIRIKELEAELAKAKTGTAQSSEALLAAEADKFFAAAVKANKAVPAEKKDIVNAFIMAAHDDGNKEGGCIVGEGLRVKALAAMVNARPTNHYSTAELLIDDGKLEASDKKDLIAGDPTQVRALLNRLTTETAATRGEHDGEKADESSGYKLVTKKVDHDAALAMTDTGRAVLATRAKNGK